MAVDFRCEHCGKLLNIEGPTGETVDCPHCHKQATVPEGLASLPRPQVEGEAPRTQAPAQAAGPGGGAQGAGEPTAEPTPEEDLEEQPEDEGELVTGVLSVSMPWVFSALFHVGLAVLMTMFLIIASNTKDAEAADEVIFNGEFSDNPGGVINPGEDNPDKQMEQDQVTEQEQYTREESVNHDVGKMDTELTAVGLTGGGMSGGLAKQGLNSGGDGRGPKSNFLGSGGNAHHVVFVIDRSGSMAIDASFNDVKNEMAYSIMRLHPVQTFHIILFDKGTTIEGPSNKLVPASEENKDMAAEFLDKQFAQGQTDPIPALRRAFQVLAAADKSKRGKIVYLLTDGEFPDNDAVIKLLKSLNRSNEVFVNTFLYGSGGDDRDKEAARVLDQIANDNGGDFKRINRYR
jgi:hypothetical protein